MDKCLIFEPGYTGHRSEYVIHLMKFINNNPELYGKYIFTLDERIRDSVKMLNDTNSFTIIYNNFNKQHRNSLERSLWQWKKISSILPEQADIKEIIFLELDPYLILINSNKFKKFNLSVKGILFQPYSHFKASAGGVKFFFRVFLKNYLSQRIIFSLNSRVKKCFILNDKASVGMMNKKIKGIFYFLPDPIDDDIPVLDSLAVEKTVAKYRIDKSKKILLLFGQIDERKNLLNIIDSIRLFPDEVKGSLSLVVAGKFSNKVRERYIQYIDKYKDEINIVYNDAFVTDDEREVIFQNCDLVFMPYIDFFSSSGVLGHAILHGKRVIVSSLGLLKEIVAEHDLGIAVDPLDVKSINNATSILLFGNECLNYDNQKFIDEHKPANFSKILLKT